MSKLAPQATTGTSIRREVVAKSAPAGISVVVPTLNEEKTLEQVLKPLRAIADDFGMELIVSDGGSTDATLSIALELADRVATHDAEERQTISAGRNAGARLASGEVLLFFNADVEFPKDLKGYLSAMIEAALDVGAATCRVAVHPNRAVLADRFVLGICNFLFCSWNWLGFGMGRGECHVVRADVFHDVGGYDESLVAGEDFDLYRRIANRARRNRKRGIRFLWKHVIYEDPRRYRQRGYFRTMLDWLLNSISVSFLGKSHSRTWDAVR